METTTECNDKSDRGVQEEEPDVLHEGVWGDESASLQGQRNGERLASLEPQRPQTQCLETGCWRVSLHRKVRSGAGSLTCQAEQFGLYHAGEGRR